MSPPVKAVVQNGLDLVLLFSFDQFGWWLDEVGPIHRCFVIGG